VAWREEVMEDGTEIVVDIERRADRCQFSQNYGWCSIGDNECVLIWTKGHPVHGMTASAPPSCPLRKGPVVFKAVKLVMWPGGTNNGC
jgi:hypothetical protein